MNKNPKGGTQETNPSQKSNVLIHSTNYCAFKLFWESSNLASDQILISRGFYPNLDNQLKFTQIEII